MRICHIVSADLWAGAEVQVATMASYLVERTDVHLVAVLMNEGRLADELRTLGADVVVIDERRHNAAGIVRILRRVLRTRQIELVHTHRYKETVLGAIAARLAGVPHLVRTIHGLPEPMRGWDRAKFRLYEALDKAALWCFADRIVAVSRQMVLALSAAGYRQSALTLVHNGVDWTRIRPSRRPEEVRAELGVTADALLVGTVGRLSPVKGHDDFLKAAKLILAKRPDARFLIIGGGPRRDALAARAAELGISAACILTGPRDDVHDVVNAMNIFVLSSLSEGIPMALLEAMALGRPVVATCVGGVPEIVRNGQTGLLVPPRNAGALADACLELTSNRDRAQRLGASARRIVETQFSHEAQGQALVDLYGSVARRPGASRHPLPAWRLAVALLWYAARTVRGMLERLRMHWIRQNPAALTAALRGARTILIVCQGNIIRSPFAARLVAQGLGERRRVEIVSGGLEAISGRPPHTTAVRTATALEVDLSDHAATLITADRVAASDVIFVMDVGQLSAMRRRFPEARGRTFLLTCLTPGVPLEIRDPFGCDEAVFRACYEHISSAVRPIVRVLSTAAQAS